MSQRELRFVDLESRVVLQDLVVLDVVGPEAYRQIINPTTTTTTTTTTITITIAITLTITNTTTKNKE